MKRRRSHAEDALARFAVIDDRFRYELRKRSGFGLEQFPASAWGGDRDAIMTCAGMAAVLVEELSVRPEDEGVKAWLVDALHQIHGGEEPNDAFRWSRHRRGRRAGEFETLYQKWLALQSIAGALQADPTIPLKTAIGRAARLVKASDRAVRAWWVDAGKLAARDKK